MDTMWRPFRRSRRDTEPQLVEPVHVELNVTEACGQCLMEYRDSPGHWHVESPTTGLCNACWFAERDGLASPYSRTKIGF